MIPTVSVVMPVYNPGRHLSAAVEAVLRQSWTCLELIAVNDGSSDSSAGVLDSLARSDSRLRVIHLAENRGAPTARNVGLEAARGQYVAMNSHDDISHPQRIARQRQFLEEQPGFGAVCSAVDFINGEGRALGAAEVPASSDLELRVCSLFENPFHVSSLMFRRSLLEDPTLRYETRVPQRSEYAFHLRLLAQTAVGTIPEALVTYVLHGANMSIRSRHKVNAQENLLVHERLSREFPERGLSLDDIAGLRAAICGQPGVTGRSLQATKAAWKLYFDLLTAYREKCTGMAAPAAVAKS